MFVKKNNIWLILLVMVGFSIACGLGEQTDEANKLVDAANVLVKSSNDLDTKSSALFQQLLGDSLSTVKDIDAYKKENKAKFDELTTMSEQKIKSMSDAADKFDQASKLKLNDKFKDYLSIKVQEFRKRTDADKLVPPIVKLFLDAKDVDTWNKGIREFNTKTADLIKEADDLSKKADQIVKDNPTIIK